MKRLLNKGIGLSVIILMILCLLPYGILANEINNDDPAITINSLNELPDMSQNENIGEQVVVIYSNSSENNIKELSLNTETVQSGEQISDRVDVLEVSESTDVDQLIYELKDNPNILAVGRNNRIEVSELPNDPYIIDGSAWQFERIGAEKTWNTVANSETIVVAVIDTGLNTEHPDLVGKTVAGFDYVSGQEAVVDLAGHGTLVSGCIGAVANNGLGIAGVTGAADIKIAPYRTGGISSSDNTLDVAYVCAAIMDASERSDIKVINMSFGGYGDFPTLQTAVEYAVSKGKILVASSGNEGDSAVYGGNYAYPSSYDGVISIAATTEADGHPSFSQYNDKVDLAAPGESIYTTTAGGAYASVSGTSFSGPIVAGSCAVLLAADPNLTATEVEGILKDTALDLGDTGSDHYFGSGLVQIDKAVEFITPKVPLTGIAVNKTNVDLIKGTSEQLSVNFIPSDTTDNKTIAWASSDITVANVDSSGNITALKAGTCIVTATVGAFKTESTVSVKNSAEDIGCTYQTHVENIGWQGWKTEGEISGTSGQSLRLEGIEITMDNQGFDLGVAYQTHVQNIGWQGFKNDGVMSGTSGQSLRLEAIQIKLTGADADKCDIYYQVHAENYGWLGWAKNGESAGTEGFGYRLEAIKIVVVPKGDSPPGTTNQPFIKNVYCSYQTHVQNIGWQGWKSKGELSGTFGEALRLEGIEIKTNDPGNLGVDYQTHVENIGWQGFKSDGEMSGTSGQSLRLEAIQMKLTGTDADRYDIYYQVHAENYGWLDWAKNGESAGTEGFGYRLEAIKIVVVEKGSHSPGATINPFVKR